MLSTVAEPGLLPVNATLSVAVTVYAFAASLSEPFAVCTALLNPYVVLPTVQPLEQVVSGTAVAEVVNVLTSAVTEARPATADVVGGVRRTRSSRFPASTHPPRP